MAIPKIKATFSLDVETSELLARVAKNLNVSKSEALTRSIHAAAEKFERLQDEEALSALSALQKSMNLSKESAAKRVDENTEIRQSSFVRESDDKG